MEEVKEAREARCSKGLGEAASPRRERMVRQPFWRVFWLLFLEIFFGLATEEGGCFLFTYFFFLGGEGLLG